MLATNTQCNEQMTPDLEAVVVNNQRLTNQSYYRYPNWFWGRPRWEMGPRSEGEGDLGETADRIQGRNWNPMDPTGTEKSANEFVSLSL
jgi:hypothetical protein